MLFAETSNPGFLSQLSPEQLSPSQPDRRMPINRQVSCSLCLSSFGRQPGANGRTGERSCGDRVERYCGKNVGITATQLLSIRGTPVLRDTSRELRRRREGGAWKEETRRRRNKTRRRVFPKGVLVRRLAGGNGMWKMNSWVWRYFSGPKTWAGGQKSLY